MANKITTIDVDLWDHDECPLTQPSLHIQLDEARVEYREAAYASPSITPGSTCGTTAASHRFPLRNGPFLPCIRMTTSSSTGTETSAGVEFQ